MSKIFFFLTFQLALFICAFNTHAQKIPDIILPCLNNDTISLSAFQGKILLIECWASWNRQSRENHRQLRNIYDRYKLSSFQGAISFDIISISIDIHKTEWETAIEMDELNWGYHCCELKGWKSEAVKKLNIYQIPYYILIDPEGNIIRKFPHLNELDRYLQGMMLK